MILKGLTPQEKDAERASLSLFHATSDYPTASRPLSCYRSSLLFVSLIPFVFIPFALSIPSFMPRMFFSP